MEKIQVLFKPEKSNGYFTWRPIYIFESISLNSSLNEKFVLQSFREKPKHTLLSVTYSENHAFYEIMWKNVLQPDMQQMKI